MPFQAGPITFFTVSEVALRWGIRPESVTRHHVKVGGLKVQSLGRNAVVSTEDLQMYEDRLRKSLLGRRKVIDAMLKRISTPVTNGAAT